MLQAAEGKAAKTATELKSKKDELVKAEQDIQVYQLIDCHCFCIHFGYSLAINVNDRETADNSDVQILTILLTARRL